MDEASPTSNSKLISPFGTNIDQRWRKNDKQREQCPTDLVSNFCAGIMIKRIKLMCQTR